MLFTAICLEAIAIMLQAITLRLEAIAMYCHYIYIYILLNVTSIIWIALRGGQNGNHNT